MNGIFRRHEKSAGIGDSVTRVRSRKLGFATSVGRVRRVDEDSILAMDVGTAFSSDARTRRLLMLADGMGGHRRGDVASRIAVQVAASTLLPLLTSEGDISKATYYRELQAAVASANRAILGEARKNPEYEGMGTTLCIAVVDRPNVLHVANVGDSRVYIVNDHEICQVTRDHSLVQEMVERGEILPEEARHHPRKNVITRVVGYYGEVEADIGCLTVVPGDMVLLCCDGLTNHVEDDEILRLVAESSDPQRACEMLVAMANEAGGTDNISVILAPAVTIV